MCPASGGAHTGKCVFYSVCPRLRRGAYREVCILFCVPSPPAGRIQGSFCCCGSICGKPCGMCASACWTTCIIALFAAKRNRFLPKIHKNFSRNRLGMDNKSAFVYYIKGTIHFRYRRSRVRQTPGRHGSGRLSQDIFCEVKKDGSSIFRRGSPRREKIAFQ